jgi:shikimate O-hydroxycinnamoyltransferase
MAMAETDSRPVKGTLLETDLQIISWLGMPMYEADFGWGKPRVMLRAESTRGGFVYLMNDGPADDGVRVLMCMEAANMKELERLLYEKLYYLHSKL